MYQSIKTNLLLKIVSILLIASGTFSLIVVLFGLFVGGVFLEVETLLRSDGPTLWPAFIGVILIMSMLVYSVVAALELFAGIRGLLIRPKAVGTCRVLGIIMLSAVIFFFVASIITGFFQLSFAFMISIILPILYLVGIHIQKRRLFGFYMWENIQCFVITFETSPAMRILSFGGTFYCLFLLTFLLFYVIIIYDKK